MLSKHTHHFWQVLDVHAAHAATAAATVCCGRHCTQQNRAEGNTTETLSGQGALLDPSNAEPWGGLKTKEGVFA
jgi:hypothetical protein